MLIAEPRVFAPDFILSLMSRLEGRRAAHELRRGVYEIGHFGGSNFLSSDQGYYSWTDEQPELPSGLGFYGVCDGVENLLERCPELETSDRRFVVTLHTVKRSEQPSQGGWRWRKWGEYIGDHEITTEYLHDEALIDQVCVYHIHEKKPT